MSFTKHVYVWSTQFKLIWKNLNDIGGLSIICRIQCFVLLDDVKIATRLSRLKTVWGLFVMYYIIRHICYNIKCLNYWISVENKQGEVIKK